MEASDFEVGDVVRLNCCATRLTVDKIIAGHEDGEIVCIWFDDAKELRSAHFHPAQLIPVGRTK